MVFLGIDIGTTNTKAGLFRRDGTVARVARRETREHRDARGAYYYDPEEMWATVAAAIREAVAGVPPSDVAAVGVAGMAETGLLLDRGTLRPRTPFVPWFDDSCLPLVEMMRAGVDPRERFLRTGLHPNFKHGLVKILWLRERDAEIADGALWLSAPGYAALRLTGIPAFDPTLAARTYAFRVDTRAWDADWLDRFGLSPDLFPPVFPSGAPIGAVGGPVARDLGLAPGTPVGIAGHDHICAGLAVGAISPGVVMDSMGTAETLLGATEERPITEQEYRSGLSYGPHVAAGRRFWLGGLPASGGSVEWVRALLGAEPVPYDDLLALAASAGDGPTGILYFPFLSGSGAPIPDPDTQGAFIGLEEDCSRAQVVKAVLEGTAYEMEAIRRSAEAANGAPIERSVVVGGGTHNPLWLQVKADVTGCRLEVPDIPEAAALGAAMAAGIGAGAYADAEDAVRAVHADRDCRCVLPDAGRHALYQRYFLEGYQPLQDPLRRHFDRMAALQSETAGWAGGARR